MFNLTNLPQDSEVTLTGGDFGKRLEVLKKLQLLGISLGNYLAIGTNQNLADEVATCILRNQMFTPPQEQIQKLLYMNEALWHDPEITADAICKIGPPPNWPLSDEGNLRCLTLLYETGDVEKTFFRNWEACVRCFGSDRVLKNPLFKNVKQRKGAKDRQQGFRWQVCELGRIYSGLTVAEVRKHLDTKKVMGIGQEGPLVAFQHPKWVWSMNQGSIPFLDMPDLEVDAHTVPCLSVLRDVEKVWLNYHPIADKPQYFGIGSGSLPESALTL